MNNSIKLSLIKIELENSRRYGGTSARSECNFSINGKDYTTQVESYIDYNYKDQKDLLKKFSTIRPYGQNASIIEGALALGFEIDYSEIAKAHLELKAQFDQNAMNELNKYNEQMWEAIKYDGFIIKLRNTFKTTCKNNSSISMELNTLSKEFFMRTSEKRISAKVTIQITMAKYIDNKLVNESDRKIKHSKIIYLHLRPDSALVHGISDRDREYKRKSDEDLIKKFLPKVLEAVENELSNIEYKIIGKAQEVARLAALNNEFSNFGSLVIYNKYEYSGYDRRGTTIKKQGIITNRGGNPNYITGLTFNKTTDDDGEFYSIEKIDGLFTKKQMEEILKIVKAAKITFSYNLSDGKPIEN